MRTQAEIGEDYGYQRGRCPRCRQTVWSDTGWFECSYCGYGADGEAEDESDELHDNEEQE